MSNSNASSSAPPYGSSSDSYSNSSESDIAYEQTEWTCNSSVPGKSSKAAMHPRPLLISFWQKHALLVPMQLSLPTYSFAITCKAYRNVNQMILKVVTWWCLYSFAILPAWRRYSTELWFAVVRSLAAEVELDFSFLMFFVPFSVSSFHFFYHGLFGLDMKFSQKVDSAFNAAHTLLFRWCVLSRGAPTHDRPASRQSEHQYLCYSEVLGNMPKFCWCYLPQLPHVSPAPFLVGQPGSAFST